MERGEPQQHQQNGGLSTSTSSRSGSSSSSSGGTGGARVEEVVGRPLVFGGSNSASIELGGYAPGRGGGGGGAGSNGSGSSSRTHWTATVARLLRRLLLAMLLVAGLVAAAAALWLYMGPIFILELFLVALVAYFVSGGRFKWFYVALKTAPRDLK